MRSVEKCGVDVKKCIIRVSVEGVGKYVGV